MIKILLSGCNGKMGQVITRLSEEYSDLEIVAGLDSSDCIKNSYPVYNSISNIHEKIDVIIDFSHPSLFSELLEFATSKNIPLVMATTGLSMIQVNQLKYVSTKIPIFFTANMSLGVNLLINLVKKTAVLLNNTFDIEIIEKHHNQKIDAPSGTALYIADSINSAINNTKNYIFDRHSLRKPRDKNEIGIHSVRGGTIAGEHSVIFAGNDEIIEINHTALSKDVFGTGALNAARFLYNKSPGLYDMENLVNELVKINNRFD